MNRDRNYDNTSRKKRLLLAANGKVGTHREEELATACLLRDAGFEVVYVGSVLIPEAIAASAIQEGVDLVCLSMTSDKVSFFRSRICDSLRKSGVDDISVVDFGLLTYGTAHRKTYLSPLLAPCLKEAFVQNHRKGDQSTSLSRREIEILKLIAEGKSTKEIAAILHLSVRTVDNHRSSIKRKLKVSKSTNLVRHALSMGYVAA